MKNQNWICLADKGLRGGMKMGAIFSGRQWEGRIVALIFGRW
jgi:hypothetical protein